MKNKIHPLAAAIVLSISAFVAVPACHADGPYHLLKEIAVGGDGGWDTLSVEVEGRRLYVSHATKVVVVDLTTDKVTGEIDDTPGVHGFAVATGLERGFSSNGKESTASVVDLKTLKTLSKVTTGENPDVIIYEPGKQEVYAFNGRGNSATVIAAKSAKVVATVALPGKPEFAAADAKAGRVYCNIEDKNEVVAIDTATHQVVATWPIAPGEGASGMALDAEHHRLFFSCGNKLMAMMDSESGKVLATVPIGDRADGTAFDHGTQLVFSSNGEGNVTVARKDGDKLTVVQTLTTERGARTMALDPKTHRIYLPSAKYEAMPEAAPGAQRQRPKMVAGSFKILVYGIENPEQL